MNRSKEPESLGSSLLGACTAGIAGTGLGGIAAAVGHALAGILPPAALDSLELGGGTGAAGVTLTLVLLAVAGAHYLFGARTARVTVARLIGVTAAVRRALADILSSTTLDSLEFGGGTGAAGVALALVLLAVAGTRHLLGARAARVAVARLGGVAAAAGVGRTAAGHLLGGTGAGLVALANFGARAGLFARIALAFGDSGRTGAVGIALANLGAAPAAANPRLGLLAGALTRGVAVAFLGRVPAAAVGAFAVFFAGALVAATAVGGLAAGAAGAPLGFRLGRLGLLGRRVLVGGSGACTVDRALGACGRASAVGGTVARTLALGFEGLKARVALAAGIAVTSCLGSGTLTSFGHGVR